jgi:hypothetical protein
MKLSKTVVGVLFACAALLLPGAAAADDSFEGALQRNPAVHPSQYSFVDLYRATLAAPAASVFPVSAADAPMRVATAQAPAQFSVADVREPRLGLLLLSGFAAAVWVARRRLGYAL